MSSQFSSLPRLPRTDRGGRGRRPPSPLCFWVGGSGRIFSPFPSTGIPLSLFSPPSRSLFCPRAPKKRESPLRRRRRYLDAGGGGGGEMMPKYFPRTQIHFLLFTQQLRSLLLLMMFPRLPPRLDCGGFLDPNYTTHAPALHPLRDASLAKIAIIPRSPPPPPRQ